MPAYIIAQISITDAKQYAEYTRLTPAAIEKYGGHFIVRGGRSEPFSKGPPIPAGSW